MTRILADVGGTNTRMARSADGTLDPSTLRWFRNDDFPDFASVLAAYGTGGAAELCVAIAGPVTGRIARLTNRNWTIDADAFGLPCTLMNDLQAVGFALDVLPDGAMAPICPGAASPGAQRLVVGLGTGVNVSLVAGSEVLRAELGHASLPSAVADGLMATLGKAPFASIEEAFCGKGLERLHTLRTGHAVPAAQIIAEAPQSVRLYAEALGRLTTQLVYIYLPLGGIVLNGGLARAVMGTAEGRTGFANGFRMDAALGGQFALIPVDLVTDDAAALYGCAQVHHP
ncbi:MAG: glucokinase [Pseudomonadota bacterium]